MCCQEHVVAYDSITTQIICRDLRALLKLLTHLTQRDLIDFGSTEEESAAGAGNGAGQAVDVAQLVFLGLDILIPLISLELLGYPKLCLLYFQLLAYMMEVSPTIAHLQGQLTIVVLISRCLSIAKGPALLLCHLKCAVYGATADGLKWLFSATVVHDKNTVM